MKKIRCAIYTRKSAEEGLEQEFNSLDVLHRGRRRIRVRDPSRRYCQVDEKLADRPPRYWARARREPAMLGIRNGCQPQLDSTVQTADPLGVRVF